MAENVKVDETKVENTQQNISKGGKLTFFRMYINFCKKMQKKYKYGTYAFIFLVFGFFLYRTNFQKELNNLKKVIKKN